MGHHPNQTKCSVMVCWWAFLKRSTSLAKVFWGAQGPRCPPRWPCRAIAGRAGVGYIRRKKEGTFGYIRVHSGTLRPFQTFEKTHENQRFRESTLFSRGTFAATTHPFYKTKKGELEFRCEPPFSHDVAI